MDAYNHATFDWVQFPRGRARFAGGFRCWDETGRKTFALDLGGQEYFGEIKRLYLENQNDYNIAIDAFGCRRGEDVGMPGAGTRGIFTPGEEALARNLVIQLVMAGLKFADPPTVLDQTETSQFVGKVEFLDGWILVGAEGSGTVAR